MDRADTAIEQGKQMIFISHSHKVEPLASTLADYLGEHGLSAWLSTRELRPGENWAGAVTAAIQESKATVLIIDSDSPSDALRREWSLALESWWSHRDEKQLVPLLIGEVEAPSFLAGIEAIRVADPSADAENQFSLVRSQLEQPRDEDVADPGDSDPANPKMAPLFERLENAIELLSSDEADLDLLRDNRQALESELDFLLAAPEPDSETLVTARRMLSLLDRELGEQPAAKEHLEAAIATQEEIDATAPEMARMLTALGRVLQNLGADAEAVEKLERSLAIQRQMSGSDSAALAITLQSLGTALIKNNDLSAARGPLEEALAINESELGLAHPNVAGIASLLGSVLQREGDLDSATALYERFLNAHEQTDQGDPEAVADLSHGLGRALRELGNAEQARDFLERALAQNRDLHGDDFRVAGSAVELARALDDLGELNAAGERYQLALEIYRAVDDAECIIGTLSELGTNLRRRDDFAGSVRILEEALAKATEVNDQHNRAEILYSLGLSLRESGDTAGAEERFLAALELGTAVYGETHSRVRKYQRALARQSATGDQS